MSLSNLNEVDAIIEKCFGPLLKEGSLQYIEKELIGGENDMCLLIVINSPLDERPNENEESYINEQYKNFNNKLNVSSSNYNNILFVIAFCSEQLFNEIVKKTGLEYSLMIKKTVFSWGRTRREKEFIKSLKEFLYPISIKPAKRS
jgi:hypothetical protein